MHVCQNCIHGNNKKGKWIRRRFRNQWPEGSWHIFCEKKKKYFPWDRYKHCFEVEKLNLCEVKLKI